MLSTTDRFCLFWWFWWDQKHVDILEPWILRRAVDLSVGFTEGTDSVCYSGELSGDQLKNLGFEVT